MQNEIAHIKQNLKRPVVLVGMMGTGKSQLGAALARKLGVQARDSDTEVEARAGLSVAEIFERYGEEKFRASERDAVAALLEGGGLSVVSTGGGAVLDAGTLKLIRDKSVSVWLDVAPEILYARLKNKTDRPLLRGGDPLQKLRDLLDHRRDLYAAADIRLEVGADEAARETLEKLIRALFKHLNTATF